MGFVICCSPAWLDATEHRLELLLQIYLKISRPSAISSFIEAFYNRTKLHSPVGYIAAFEMELRAA